MPGEQLDLSSDPPALRAAASTGSSKRSQDSIKEEGRSFVGIRFGCCDIYSRVYINRTETAYEGNCPRCSRRCRVKIGPGGSDSRFFNVY